MSCWALEGREVTEVDKKVISDAISVFVFLVGQIVEEFDRCA